MTMSSQSGRKATSGKETVSLADGSSSLPPLPKSSQGKGPSKAADYRKQRERNLRYITGSAVVKRARYMFFREIQQSPNAQLLASFSAGSFVQFMEKVCLFSRVCDH
jgi:hypothetical protein